MQSQINRISQFLDNKYPRSTRTKIQLNQSNVKLNHLWLNTVSKNSHADIHLKSNLRTNFKNALTHSTMRPGRNKNSVYSALMAVYSTDNDRLTVGAVF